MKDSFFGWFVTIRFEEIDYLDVGDLKGDSFEGDEELNMSSPQSAWPRAFSGSWVGAGGF